MTMRLAVLMVSLIGLAGGTFVAGHLASAAAEVGGKVVVVRFDDSSRGDLAVRAGGPWRVARRGENLPADGILRTSAAGPCRMQIGDGTLQLAPETQAQVITTERRIVVTAGR